MPTTSIQIKQLHAKVNYALPYGSDNKKSKNPQEDKASKLIPYCRDICEHIVTHHLTAYIDSSGVSKRLSDKLALGSIYLAFSPERELIDILDCLTTATVAKLLKAGRCGEHLSVTISEFLQDDYLTGVIEAIDIYRKKEYLDNKLDFMLGSNPSSSIHCFALVDRRGNENLNDLANWNKDTKLVDAWGTKEPLDTAHVQLITMPQLHSVMGLETKEETTLARRFKISKPLPPEIATHIINYLEQLQKFCSDGRLDKFFITDTARQRESFCQHIQKEINLYQKAFAGNVIQSLLRNFNLYPWPSRSNPINLAAPLENPEVMRLLLDAKI